MSTIKSDIAQYLSFVLGEEDFAFDISRVKEVLEYTRITKVPQMPNYMLGVINLRGSVVPVIDMRVKFSLDQTDKTVETCIIIVEVGSEDDSTVLGALVDSVKEVFELDSSQIEPAPRIGAQINTAFLKGMGKKDDGFILVLDLDTVFSEEELTLAKAVKEREEGVPVQ